jgi:hypothetical protein
LGQRYRILAGGREWGHKKSITDVENNPGDTLLSKTLHETPFSIFRVKIK